MQMRLSSFLGSRRTTPIVRAGAKIGRTSCLSLGRFSGPPRRDGHRLTADHIRRCTRDPNSLRWPRGDQRMTFRGRPSDDAEDDGVGYRKPPRTTRFTKGQSGNPAGRPRGRHREAPYEAVLGQMVTIREDGTERLVTAAEAFLLQLTKRGLEGDSAAARASLAVIEQAGQRHGTGQFQVRTLTLNFLEPGSVTPAMEPLRMARKLDPYRKTVRIVREPWLVEAALARLPQTLSAADQRIIVQATRTPHKVKWPKWWSEHP